jgi:rod shape-determining protein MreB
LIAPAQDISRQWRYRFDMKLNFFQAATRMTPDIAIDFGTANTRVVVPGFGVVFDEPSLCCYSLDDVRPKLIAAGNDALPMLDRTGRSGRIARPLARGVLNDMGAGREMLRYAIERSGVSRRMGFLRAVIGIPADATQAEASALVTTAHDAGLRHVELIAEPLAAAIGMGLPVSDSNGSMIIECGAGTTEVVVLSMGAICLRRSVRLGGLALDSAITEHMHLRHKLLIGAATAERLKLEVVGPPGDLNDRIAVKGRSIIHRGPATIEIARRELEIIVERHAMSIVAVVRDALNETPPELSRDIHDNGIMLTGGCAAISMIEQAVREGTGLATHVAEDALHCVANGLCAAA